MSDSEDDMPMIARRRPADGPVVAAAALATKPAAPAPATATATAPPATLNNKPAMKPEPNTVAAPVNVEQKHKIEDEKPVKHGAAATPKQGAHNQPGPVKQEAKPDDSSDDDDEDVPLNVLQHRKQAGKINLTLEHVQSAQVFALIRQASASPQRHSSSDFGIQ
jgi:hypothetical protein